MAEKQPKPYIVYWTSKFNTYVNGRKGDSTPRYKANSKSVNTLDEAIELHNKLKSLEGTGVEYRGRLVYHVGGFSGH